MRVCKAGDNLIKCPHMGDIEDYKKEVEWITDCTKESIQEAIADLEDLIKQLDRIKENKLKELEDGTR